MSFLNGKSAKGYVLAISIACFAVPLLFIVGQVMEHTHGVFAYPLDDSYIHLAVAKYLAHNNVWGVSPVEFSSASSSILYPFLLAGIFKITGVITIVPFIVNVIFGIWFLVVLQNWLIRQDITLGGQLVVMLLCVFLIPLPAIVMVGMEHTLHLFFFFLFLTSFSEALQDMVASSEKKRDLPWQVYLYGFLMITARFESMCMLGVACIMLLVYRRWMVSIKLGFICFLPILVFGIYSVMKGSYFLPNSVLLKPSLPGADIFYTIRENYYPRLFSSDVYYNTLGAQRLVLIIPIAYLLFFRVTKERIAYQYMLLSLLVCTIFHLATMSYSFFARYEAYLVGSFVAVFSLLLIKYAKMIAFEKNAMTEYVAWFLGILLLLPVVTRSYTIFDDVALGAICTYDQQVQMGRFVGEFYNHEGVAINDLGGVCYQSEGPKLDLWGLGNVEVARARKNQTDSSGFFDSLARKKDIKIGVFYENRFRSLSRRWVKVASWDIPYKNQGIHDSVAFFAINPSDAPLLKKNLEKFQPSLPHGVKVTYTSF